MYNSHFHLLCYVILFIFRTSGNSKTSLQMVMAKLQREAIFKNDVGFYRWSKWKQLSIQAGSTCPPWIWPLTTSFQVETQATPSIPQYEQLSVLPSILRTAIEAQSEFSLYTHQLLTPLREPRYRQMGGSSWTTWERENIANGSVAVHAGEEGVKEPFAGI